MTREDIIEFAVELDVAHHPEFGGTPPTTDKIVDLLDIQGALETVSIQIDELLSFAAVEDLATAKERIAARSKLHNPFKLMESKIIRLSDWLHRRAHGGGI